MATRNGAAPVDHESSSRVPLEVHFYCNSVPFSRETIELRTSLGGSESALIYLARGLAELGHRVVIYTLMARDAAGNPWALHYRQPWGERPNSGIHWLDFELMDGFLRGRQPDVFVSLRMPPVMGMALLGDCKLRVLWNEDLLADAPGYLGHAWQTDRHVFVSEYHRQQHVRAIPDIADLTWVTRNPVDTGQIAAAIEGVEKEPNRLIHASRPERALVHGDRSPLLEVFARMRATRPDLTLGVCRYHSMYEGTANVAAICQRAGELVAQTEGVEWLGELDKQSLYREIARSQLMIYPGVPDFAETGCIAATEAQLCGTPLLGTQAGALPETLSSGGGYLIAGDATTDAYQEAFAARAFQLLDHPRRYARFVRMGRAHAVRYDYRVVAAEWAEWLYGTFAARYETRKPAVLRQLLWHDDMRGARQVAGELPAETADTVRATVPDGTTESPDEYADRAMEPALEASILHRAHLIEAALKSAWPAERAQPKRILDFAGGNGAYAGWWLERFPEAQIDLVDYSSRLCDVAREYLSTRGFAERFTVTCGSVDEIPRSDYDLVFAGEITEHYERPEEFLTALEAHCRRPVMDLDSDEPVTDAGGVMLITVPQGAYGGLQHRASFDWSAHARGHKIAFEARDLEEMLEHKPRYNHLHATVGTTPRGEAYGNLLVWWSPSDEPVRPRNDWRKVTRTRPYESLAVCMIVRDGEADIVRALQSVDWIADEVWVADTGSTDRTMDLARPYIRNGGDVWSIGVCPDAPAELPPPRDFGWARNESVSRTEADWILWLDADEQLINPFMLRMYCAEGPYNGYAIHQCHLTMDQLSQKQRETGLPYDFDKPVRLFRRVPRGKQAGITPQCYAVIHEHFQHGLNELIQPALELTTVEIAHLGYLTERLRRAKCQTRNIPLLQWEMQKYPDRRLSRLLVAREYVNMAIWERQAQHQATGRGDLPIVESHDGLVQALGILRQDYFDPADDYWEATLPMYQQILALLDAGAEYGVFELRGTKMIQRRWRFACHEDYAKVARFYIQRRLDVDQMPDITWDDAVAQAESATAPIVGASSDEAMRGVALTAAGEVTGEHVDG